VNGTIKGNGRTLKSSCDRYFLYNGWLQDYFFLSAGISVFKALQSSTIMTDYISYLLTPFFDHVRTAFLRDPVARSLFVPILCFEGPSSTNDAYFTNVDTATVLQRLYHFIKYTFPEPRISTLRHIPSASGTVGRYIDHFSIVIHGRIAEALAVEAQQSENSPTHKRQLLLLRFLVTVNIIHDFAHKARSFFNGIHLATCNVEGYPYASECSHLDYFFRLPEAGYMAERALFGGIVGVVFQDEIEGERLPFLISDTTRYHISISSVLRTEHIVLVRGATFITDLSVFIHITPHRF
jgi:hypothetical protein